MKYLGRMRETQTFHRKVQNNSNKNIDLNNNNFE